MLSQGGHYVTTLICVTIQLLFSTLCVQCTAEPRVLFARSVRRGIFRRSSVVERATVSHAYDHRGILKGVCQTSEHMLTVPNICARPFRSVARNFVKWLANIKAENVFYVAIANALGH